MNDDHLGSREEVIARLRQAQKSCDEWRTEHDNAVSCWYEERDRLSDKLRVAEATIVSLSSTLMALRDQIDCDGCTAAHYGERTYECCIDTKCGLCRLRNRAENAETLLDTTAPTEDEFNTLSTLILEYSTSYALERIWFSRARKVWGY